MKFKYIGQLPIKDADLALAGIFKPNETIYQGTVFEIPDDNKSLIRRVKLSGIYVEFIEPKKRFKSKKEDKKEKIEKEEE